ncbi:iron uptake transporter deferrochelatase/peroxidase subunit [Pseudonocardia broussonetiae]|uniref:Deferrochelatase n=1 Tax=Pseudonocardia broussonetiae TaxID=2736640 RepID=A0A6M6JMB8_9PSEU|nr:iron uptake transporter deferrochelatase/peroxidase subunit [Pseudonocardia broussonetiae]QJY49118.1 deferrochelatase/peroxidase EfeB [Pseudonocardia broussonetiae]
MPRMNRRTLFGIAGAGAAAAAGAGAVLAAEHVLPASVGGGPDDVVPFRGARQAGITTAAQDHLYFVALDVTTTDRAELVDLLQRWTLAAERLTTGAEVAVDGAIGGHPEAPPQDTGEALGLPPARLTLTFGVGPSLFTRDGVDRFGIADRRPPKLIDLPLFAGDAIEPGRSNGDLCIQACADDPQVAVHAVRNLIRMGFGTTAVRWAQMGYGRTSSTVVGQATPRNMFGFKDGTSNITAEDTAGLARHVWAAAEDGADWMTGGSYLVARRIRMAIEPWDRTSLLEQEEIVGRHKGSGAALGATDEFAEVDFSATRPDGSGPLVGMDSHVRLAHSSTLGGVRILRRGYNFIDGTDAEGHLDAGLFFIAFVRDPGAQFVPMQQALSTKDIMMEYLVHTSSALFACPPGVGTGDHWGRTLFGNPA